MYFIAEMMFLDACRHLAAGAMPAPSATLVPGNQSQQTHSLPAASLFLPT